MKQLIFAVFLFMNVTWAKEIAFNCTFSTEGAEKTVNLCAMKSHDDSYVLSPKILGQIKFNQEGLVAGSINHKGCFWFHKKGLARKSHCFDNGADYFVEDLARYVDFKGRFGYMNKNLDAVIPANYTFAFPFSAGIAKVCQGCEEVKSKDSEHSSMENGEWLIIDKKGSILKTCVGAKSSNECSYP